MANDVVLKSGKLLPVGTDHYEILEGNAGVTFADLVTELKVINGVVYLSLGAG